MQEVDACGKVKTPGQAPAVTRVLLVLDELTNATQCEMALAPVWICYLALLLGGAVSQRFRLTVNVDL